MVAHNSSRIRFLPALSARRCRVAIVFVTALRSLIDSPIVRTNGPVPGPPLRHAATRAFLMSQRGKKRILTDILTRASALNLACLATLSLHHGPGGWAIA